MKLTAEILQKKGACKEQVDLFAQLFPDGGEVTAAACRAVAHQFDWDWAANHLLPEPARRAYEEATATAWRAYQEARATARRAYQEATATARRAYKEARAPARRAY